MIQSRSPESTIEHITRTIVETFHPRRVILFGSRARGDARPDSDVDLVVELNVKADYPFGLATDVARPLSGLPWDVQVTIRVPGEIERRYNDPGYVDWDIVREGKVLYRDPSLPLESWEAGAPARVRERPAEPESLREWMAHAGEDRLAIENLIAAARIPWSVVCFHAQQAAEKYLKALLVRRFIKPIRTHMLADVLQQCREHGYPLAGLDADCTRLQAYAVDTRYLGELPSESEGRAAVAAMKRIVAACESLLRS